MNKTRIIVGMAVWIWVMGPLIGLAHLSADIRSFNFLSAFVRSDVEFPILSTALWRFGPLAWWGYVTPFALATAVAATLRSPVSNSALMWVLGSSVVQFLAIAAVTKPYFAITHVMGNPVPAPYPVGALLVNVAMVTGSVGWAVLVLTKRRQQ